MTTSETFSLDSLTTYKEDFRLEVKSARGGLPNSLWESYSAFANSEGGVIVLGVKEKSGGRLVVEGLGDARKLLKDFWNIINNRQKVSCNILTDRMATTESIDGKDIIVIRVPRAERTSRPVYVGTDPRTGTYRRNFEGDYHCSRDEVSLMIRDSSLVTDDNTLLTDIDLSVFCPETIRSYRNIFKLVRPNQLWNQEDDAIFLRRIGAVREDKDTGRFHPTVAGLLMFGYEYEITAVFPNYFLDYQENRTNGISARWTDRITSQSGDWSGNVFDFILRVIPKLQSDLKVPFMFKGNFRDEDTPLHKVVREATVNMIANADFYGRRGIVVRKSAEGFKFANPGGMRVSLNEVLQDSASDPRNGVMMKMLALVEYGERAGSGLQGIFKIWQGVYGVTPKIDMSTSDGVDRTTLTLSFDGQQPDIDALKYFSGISDDILQVRDVEGVYAKSARAVQNVAQNGADIAQNGADVARNGADVAQNGADVVQNSTRVAQNIDDYIVDMIRMTPNIRRVDMAQRLGVTSKTVERHLKDLRIVWTGHPKTGHWLIDNR